MAFFILFSIDADTHDVSSSCRMLKNPVIGLFQSSQIGESWAAAAGAVYLDTFSSSIALATSPSVDPHRSPITLIACVIDFIFGICFSGVIAYFLYRLAACAEKSAAHPKNPVSSKNRSTSVLVVTPIKRYDLRSGYFNDSKGSFK